MNYWEIKLLLTSEEQEEFLGHLRKALRSGRMIAEITKKHDELAEEVQKLNVIVERRRRLDS